MTVPSVEITVADNGAAAVFAVPLNNVQLVMGCSTSGPIATAVATRDPVALKNTFGDGELVEAAGLACKAGGIVLAVRLTTAAPGTASAVNLTGRAGTSIPTLTLDGTFGAYDNYYAIVRFTKGGTVGVDGIKFQVSLDAGRNWGPIQNLGTATNYVIPNTGVTVNFAAGTFVTGDIVRFFTTAMMWNAAGLLAAFDALGGSQFALQGWGSTLLTGVCSAADATNYQNNLETLKTKQVFTRGMCSARDASPPTVWGGSGETEVAWSTSLAAAYSAVSAKRVAVGAGFYNMPSAYPNPAAGLPSYRRPLTWANAVRRVTIPTEERAGRVLSGALANIVVDPNADPMDGFVYHDERVNPSLDAARFLTAMTWVKKQGYFTCQENLMAPSDSQYKEIVLGNIVDVACAIGYAKGSEVASSNLRATKTGSLYMTDALILQDGIDDALAQQMTSYGMVSDAYCAVDTSNNVRATKQVNIKITVEPDAYVDKVSETITLVTT